MNIERLAHNVNDTIKKNHIKKNQPKKLLASLPEIGGRDGVPICFFLWLPYPLSLTARLRTRCVRLLHKQGEPPIELANLREMKIVGVSMRFELTKRDGPDYTRMLGSLLEPEAHCNVLVLNPYAAKSDPDLKEISERDRMNVRWCDKNSGRKKQNVVPVT